MGVEYLTTSPGFDPWTIQPIVSHYIDYAILGYMKRRQHNINIYIRQRQCVSIGTESEAGLYECNFITAGNFLTKEAPMQIPKMTVHRGVAITITKWHELKRW
jgi:hypothetical protein